MLCNSSAMADMTLLMNSNGNGNNGSASASSRKRKRGTNDQRVFNFKTFGDPGCPCDYDGPFRANIRGFLSTVADREAFDVEGRPAWSLALQVEDLLSHISLLIVEENVQQSRHPHCDHCRCIGWSHHLVSNIRYHFIIPAPEIGDRPLGAAAAATITATSGIAAVAVKICPSCHDAVSPSLYACPACNVEAVAGSVLDLPSHLLHGVLHCNGYGHLLSVNGREKGSRLASGREIVDLWDRICAMLRARKVSVEDLAKKRSLELRLLHCVAYGESWFGRWGYKFGHGSFGITQQMYGKAIEAIRGMPLTVMTQHFEGVDAEIIAIVTKYQIISNQALQTVGDLVRFMMELKARLPLQTAEVAMASSTVFKSQTNVCLFPKVNFSRDQKNGETPCRWSVKRLELATKVIVEALKNCDKKWMPRQDVRDAARVYIGDTGLLDFVLKSLGNRVVGGHIVKRAVNPITKVLEYSLEEVDELQQDMNANTNNNTASASVAMASSASCSSAAASAINDNYAGNAVDITMAAAASCEVGRAEVMKDIVCIYRHVLESYKPAVAKRAASKNILSAIPTAARIILDTKQMMKDYRGEMTRKCAAHIVTDIWGMDDDDEMLRVLCTIQIRDENEDSIANLESSGQLHHHHEQQHQINHQIKFNTMLQNAHHHHHQGLLDYDVLDVLLNNSGSSNRAALLPNTMAMANSTNANNSTRPNPPPELVVLPPHATVGELKREAEIAFRDTYFITRDFKLDGISGLEGVDDDDLLFGNIESGSHVVVYGRGVDVRSELRYEGGSDNWVVDCPCGTKDDDGERMIACDICEVWQHTRCGNIADSDAIPQRFLCNNCNIGLFKVML